MMLKIICMVMPIVAVVAYDMVTRAKDNLKAEEFEHEMYEQWAKILTLLDAMIDHNGKANKTVLDAIDRRNCDVYEIHEHFKKLDRVSAYKGYVRQLLRVRTSWMNKTISDNEAMKKVSDILAEIREKEKLE